MNRFHLDRGAEVEATAYSRLSPTRWPSVELAVDGVNTTSPAGVGSWIERRARVHGDRIALVHGDTRRTYTDLAERIRRLAHGFRTLGVKPGDRVVWIGSNHPAFLESLFATATLGAVLTPINDRMSPSLIVALCQEVAPRVVLHNLSRMVPSALATTVGIGVSEESDSDYERLVVDSMDERLSEELDPGNLCLLPFTSGTTGPPKGIMLTHANLTWNAINCVTSMDIRGDDVTIALAPFARTGGIGVTVLPTLFVGGTVVIARDSSPEEFIPLVQRHRVTLGFGNPHLVEALTRSPLWRTANLTTLRALVVGGAPLSDRVLKDCHTRGINMLQGYGLSEAGPLVSVLDSANALHKRGSVGRPARFVDVRIVGDDGTDCPTGHTGELLVHGPNVMAGYWNHLEATRRVIDERGWLRTGDAARRDDEGFLFVVGRVEDAYESAGRLVYPGVAERVLLEHPSVEEVCVVGGDGATVAYVALVNGVSAGIDAELRSIWAETIEADDRPIVIRYVASLPRNPNGKVLRRLLHTDQVMPGRVPSTTLPQSAPSVSASPTRA